ncbi:tyrosine-type recombinase/integrase [Acetobacter indonesiensis]|nr:tyrosine-type recombinase/integrase [Acetobacter indonesiensis]MCP1232139.1 tyrosine-type recombinase/integrase [Acetobacter indonesiensis]
MDEQASPTLLQELLTLQTQMIRDQETTLSLAEECHALEQKAEKARHAMEMLEQVQKESTFLQQSKDHLAAIQMRLETLSQHLRTGAAVSAKEKEMLRGEANRLAAMIVDIRSNQTLAQQAGNLAASSFAPLENVGAEEKPAPVKSSSPRLSVMAEKFIYSDTTKSPDTLKATRKTIDLFIEAFGDKPIRQITGTVAGEFFDLLSSLPATHGKGKTVLPLRMVIAQAQEQGQETVSGKTVKNHFSRMSSLWSHLVQRDLVDKNPWAGWDFNVTKKIVRRGWTDGELTLLASTHWSGAAVSHRTWAGIITIGMFTGMRLGEICNLRRQDIEVIDNVPCFHVRPHIEDGWSPKTAAGTRIIPIHSSLLKMEELNLLEANGEKYLFPDLTVSASGERGDNFARSFSKHKKRLGLPDAVTFHSFRHTVSTKLRNQEAHIRELWIDTVLGHEATHKSQGTMNYTSGIEVANLKQVIEALTYPPECIMPF